MTDSDVNVHSTDHELGAKIKFICKKFEGREAGSESERAASDFLAERLSEYTDDVTKDEFAVFPSAYIAATVITPTTFILAYAAYFFSTLVAAMLLLVGIAVYFVEFMLCKRMLDPLFSKAMSRNVTAVRRASEEAQRNIFFVAHVDASREWKLKRHTGELVFIMQQISNIVGSLYLAGIIAARWALVGGVGAGIAEGVMLWLGVAGAVFLPGFVATYMMFDSKRVVDGANDALSGVAVAAQTLKRLDDKGVRLKNTNVGVIFTGSSCCGLRGAKDWCEKHAAEYDRDRTVFVTLSCLRDASAITIGTTEMNLMVRNDRETIRMALAAAKRAGVKCSAHSLLFDATTDSAAFTQAGLKSVSVTAMGRILPDFYRTRTDSYDNLSEECMEEGIKLALGIIEQYSGEEVLSRFDFSSRETSELVFDSKPAEKSSAAQGVEQAITEAGEPVAEAQTEEPAAPAAEE